MFVFKDFMVCMVLVMFVFVVFLFVSVVLICIGCFMEVFFFILVGSVERVFICGVIRVWFIRVILKFIDEVLILLF